MSELSGLELRKAALEVLGWRIDRTFANVSNRISDYWHTPKCATDKWDTLTCDAAGHVHETRLPAIESDPAISEPLFESFCRARGYVWGIYLDCPDVPVIYACEVEITPYTGRETLVETYGATPSEARARAIVDLTLP